MMDRTTFEAIAEEEFAALPEMFRHNIENVHIVVEDIPTREVNARMGISANGMLLGLYEGVPLTKRGTWYGMYPVVPDKITLYQRNIETVARTEGEIRRRIREVLIHEIAHYFGMNEDEVRKAGY